MKNILKLEELAMWAFSLYGLYLMGADWWWYLLMTLGPDISMLGYVAGNKVGAYCYNFFHHKGIALVIFGIGFYFVYPVLLFIGLVLFGHASQDRVFGYGLKYEAGFKFTHLGNIGRKKI